MLEIYKNIKNRRKELKMTQTELAEKIGYTSKSAIAQIEAGKVDLPQSKIIAFAHALNTTPGELMGWENDPLYEAAKDFTLQHELIDYFNQLNDKGKVQALIMIKTLTMMDDCKKSDSMQGDI